jgi:hypothetical protein
MRPHEHLQVFVRLVVPSNLHRIWCAKKRGIFIMLKSTIIRVIAFAALFAYVLPAAFGLCGAGSSFAFTGSIFAALAVGIVYMAAMFGVLALIGLGSKPFKLTEGDRRKLAPLWGTIFLVSTMLCLLGAGSLLPVLGLSVSGFFPALLGGALAIGVMSVTMPAGSKPGASQ